MERKKELYGAELCSAVMGDGGEDAAAFEEKF